MEVKGGKDVLLISSNPNRKVNEMTNNCKKTIQVHKTTK